MKAISATQVTDALAGWGTHELRGRWSNSDTTTAATGSIIERMLGLRTVIICREPMIKQIRDANPVGIWRAEFENIDISRLIMYDGRRLEDFVREKRQGTDDSSAFIRATADKAERVEGPLICCALQTDSHGPRSAATMAIYDGNHRAAAWAMQMDRLGQYLLVVVQKRLQQTRAKPPSATGGRYHCPVLRAEFQLWLESGAARAGLTQEKFAALIQVDLSTLRNWEQGRREPTGPAKALIRVITNDPKDVLKALEVGATMRKAG